MSTRKKPRSKGLVLYKRPESPYWQIKGSMRGRTVRESTGVVSRERAETILASIENDIIAESVNGPRKDLTLFKAAEHYHAIDPGRDARFIGVLLDHLGMLKVSEIDDVAVLKFRSEAYPTASNDTVNRQVYTPLIAIITAAHEAKLCGPHSLHRPKARKHKEVEAAPETWMEDFLARCRLPNLRAVVMLLTTTGCRVSEACRLTWEKVDFTKGDAVLGRTKNGKPRRVILSDNVIDALKALDSSVAGRRCFGYASRWAVTTALRRECERLGVKYFSTHKLGRHACAARLLADGNTLGDVAMQVGWERGSLPMLYKTYGHLEQSRLDESMRTVANRVGGKRASVRADELEGT